MSLYIVSTLCVLCVSIYWFITRTFNHWKKINVAGPKPVPLFGNIKDVALRKSREGPVLQEIYNNYPNEKVVGIFKMTTPHLLIRDLDIIQHVMIKDFDNFVDRGFEISETGLGKNMFNASADNWRVLRNRFSPIFTSGKLKNMMHLMIDNGDRLIEYIDKKVSQNPQQEVNEIVKKFTVSTISACAFGLDFDVLNHQQPTIDKIDKMIFTLKHIIEFAMLVPGILKLLNISHVPRLVNDFFFSIVRNVTEQRNGQPTSRKDFIDLILAMKKERIIHANKRIGEEVAKSIELTDEVIAAQAFVFYAAGYETSANTLTFLLYELIRNPEVQEKLYNEINTVLAKHDSKITYEAINEMPYMEKVFHETLRMYPIVDFLQRKAISDYKLPGTNVTLRKGEVVVIPVYSIQRDEQYYPDPLVFDPERFSAKNIANRHSCSYIPFGIGPRNCVGLRFAKLQSRVCLTKLLSNYKIERSKNTKPFMDYDPYRSVLSPLGGIYANLVPRK